MQKRSQVQDHLIQGETISLYNAYSQTNTNDTDGIDQPITFTL